MMPSGNSGALSPDTGSAGPGRRPEWLDALGMLRALERWGDARGWVGSDPYDGLNATRLPGALTGSALARRVVTQAVKRSPLDLRPLLGIRSEANAAALAHVVSAYADGGFLDPAEEGWKLRRATEALEALRLPSYGEPAWGYPFDVQTRVFFYGRGTANSIATSFAGQALLDALARTGEERLLGLAVATGRFFLERVPQTPAPPGAYFGYLPGDRTPIHNANLLVSAFLARLGAVAGREEFVAAAEEGVRYSVARQRAEGSWPYGETSGLGWVDGYHTGYVLQALMSCRSHGIEGVPDDAIERGLGHYRRALFDRDGTPWFTTTSRYPTDSECVAQGIQTWVQAGATDPEARAFAWTIFRFARRRMRRRDGAIVFQRGRVWSIRTPHVRWAAASMLLALARLVSTEPGAG